MNLSTPTKANRHARSERRRADVSSLGVGGSRVSSGRLQLESLSSCRETRKPAALLPSIPAPTAFARNVLPALSIGTYSLWRQSFAHVTTCGLGPVSTVVVPSWVVELPTLVDAP